MTRRGMLLRAAFAVVLGARAGTVRAQRLPASAGGDHPRERIEYFVQRRAFPFDRIPSRALLTAREAMVRMPRASLFAGVQSPMSPWTPIGPAPINTNPLTSGRISAIAIHPTNNAVIYIGAAQGGVWKSVDGGNSWTPLTDNQCSLAIGAVTIDPVNPNIVYAGTGEENFSGDSYYGCGVLRTTDGGATWTTLGQSVFQTGSGGARVGKILIDQATAGTTNATLYAATSFGVYKSVNGGSTWAQLLSKGFGFATDIIAPQGSGGPLFAAATSAFVNAANGIYESLDGGLSWALVGGGLPTSNVGRIALSVSPINASVIYAGIENPSTGNLTGLYRTNDGGVTWTQFAANGVNCSTQCWYGMTVTPSPTDPNTVFFGGLSLYRSIDGGTTFTNVGSSFHVDHHALVFDPINPQVVYAGTDGGIFRSSDGGTTWANLNSNLAITQFYGGISLHPSAVSPILGGTQDNGTLEYGGALAWNAVIGGDGGFTAINPLAPTTAYGETQWAGGPRRRTTPGGAFLSIVNGINLNDRALFIPPLAIDPAHPTFLYFGTSKLYRTRNGGDAWSAISPDVTSGSDAIAAIGVASSDTLVMYTGSAQGQVQVTSNGGASWTNAVTGLPQRAVSDFAVNAARPDIAYVSMMGFGSGHVFKTANRGASWTNISGNLPNVPVSAIVAIPGGELFVGTDLGVFRSGDDGASWATASSGLPNVAVFDLAYSLPTQTLVAATHGRSMWAATVTPTLTATQLAVASGATSALSGSVIAPGFVVRVCEVTGVTVPGANNLVTAAISAGNGMLSGITSVNAVNGVATFSNLTVTGSGAQTITFSTQGLASTAVTFTPGVPTTIAVSPTIHRDTLFFGSPTVHADSATVTLAGDNAATTPWTATKLKPWITLTTAAGAGSGRVRWTRSASGLAPGTFVDTITVSANAGGSPIRIFDSLVVRSAAALAQFTPDSIVGAKNETAPLDFMMDLSALAGTALGSYNVSVTWDSTVMRLDSAKAIAGGYVAPAVTPLNAASVGLAAADPGGKQGGFALARLYFRFVSDVSDVRTSVVPAFATATSTGGANLAPGLVIRNGLGVDKGVLRGDVNGDGVVNAADAQAILQAAVGIALTPPAKGFPNGDANCNGKLEAVDAQIVLAFILGTPVTQFCVNRIR